MVYYSILLIIISCLLTSCATTANITVYDGHHKIIKEFRIDMIVGFPMPNGVYSEPLHKEVIWQ